MNKFNSIFGQILQIFTHQDFVRAVRETRAERGVKGFSCWGQFVAMVFCQLGQAHSLREICGGLATCLGKLKHLGVDAAPKRTTVAGLTPHPNEQWMTQIARNITMDEWVFLVPGQCLIHDRDRKFCPAFQKIYRRSRHQKHRSSSPKLQFKRVCREMG